MSFRKIGLIITLAALMILSLSACGTGEVQGINGNGGQEAGQATNDKPETSQEDPERSPEVNDNDKQIETENSAFRNIDLSGSNGKYIVKGEASVFEGVFYYTVEDGHEYQIEETKVALENGAPAWEPFELKITIPEDLLPLNGTLTLELFEKSSKDQSTINQYYTKLDEFGY
ncbi:MAG TPA: hypothetical protein GX497_04655 [Bacillus bacterium]|nr:hypothetical protein [Bacillus sp. (in: firmicutes)]